MNDGDDLTTVAVEQLMANDDVLVETMARRSMSLCPNPQAALRLLTASLQTLAILAQKQSQWAEAATLRRALLRLDPAEVTALGNVGDMSARRGDWVGALRWYRRALAVKPTHAAGWSALGVIATLVGREDLALAAHQRSIALAPDRSAGYAVLGETLGVPQFAAAAAAAFDRALMIDPGTNVAHWELIKLKHRFVALSPPAEAMDPPVHPLATVLRHAAEARWDAASAMCPPAHSADSRYLSSLLGRIGRAGASILRADAPTGGGPKDSGPKDSRTDDSSAAVALFQRFVEPSAADDPVMLLDLFAIDLALRPALRPRTARLALPDTTLCCVDTRQPCLGLIALKNCLA
ncbi:MAG: tetratricopeptide repeat protein [Azospirillaceae bacterium]|nr:tetratricopeptide repeat protein [Azospirillaceae bacterium]